MPDPRFFPRPVPITLERLVKETGLEIDESHYKADLEIRDLAPLATAGPNDLSFLDNIKYKQAFHQTKAGVCIIHPKFKSEAPDHICLLLSETPYKSYALLAQKFYPDPWPVKSSISSLAHIHDSASIGRDTHIEAGAIIDKDVEIGTQCWIESGAVIRPGVKLGKGCRIGANSVISHALISDHVRIYPGCCIGQDGFGFAMDQDGFTKVPQLGRVIIDQSVEIGSGTTIDRGSGPDTVIGQGTWIDNLVQIGHNVKIGKYCVIVSQCGISGSTVLEDFVALGGQVGIAGHLRIGQGSKIGAQSGVMRDVPSKCEYMGSPAMPKNAFMKQVATLKKIVKNKVKA